MINTLSDGGLEMLQAAVNAARQFQCQTVKSLKDRLLVVYPSRGADINEALKYWANDVRQRHPNGVPKY